MRILLGSVPELIAIIYGNANINNVIENIKKLASFVDTHDNLRTGIITTNDYPGITYAFSLFGSADNDDMIVVSAILSAAKLQYSEYSSKFRNAANALGIDESQSNVLMQAMSQRDGFEEYKAITLLINRAVSELPALEKALSEQSDDELNTLENMGTDSIDSDDDLDKLMDLALNYFENEDEAAEVVQDILDDPNVKNNEEEIVKQGYRHLIDIANDRYSLSEDIAGELSNRAHEESGNTNEHVIDIFKRLCEEQNKLKSETLPVEDTSTENNVFSDMDEEQQQELYKTPEDEDDIFEDDKKEQEVDKKEQEADKKDQEADPKTIEEFFDKLDEIKKSGLFRAAANSTIDYITNTLAKAYESNFSGLGQIGLLFDSKGAALSIVAASREKGSLTFPITEVDDGTSHDRSIYVVLASIYKEYGNLLDKEEIFPFDDLKLTTNFSMPKYCLKLHSQFQKAYIKSTAKARNDRYGLTSIRTFINRNTLKNNEECKNFDEWVAKKNKGKDNIVNFKTIKSWYRWVIQNLIAYGIILNNIDYNMNMSNPEYSTNMLKVQNISDRVQMDVLNAIIVADRSAGIEEGLKLISLSEKNFDVINSALLNKLDPHKTHTIEIANLSDKSDKSSKSVTEFKVVFNKKEANKSDLFAYEALDQLKISGNTPTWDNVLLGRDERGGFMFWNFERFKEAKDCAYCIYAGSGAGKGVMTSSLLAAALGSKNKIFYTDFKPDNSAVIGRVAWKLGREAYTFNGSSKGLKAPFDGPFEQWSEKYDGSLMRDQEEPMQYTEKLAQYDDLWNFGNWGDESKKEFLGLMRYLKSLDLFTKITNARATDRNVKDVCVWVFDEATQASNIEKNVRKHFAAYLGSKGLLTQKQAEKPYKGMLSGEKVEKAAKEDPCIAYIQNWLAWTENIENQLLILNKISLRGSSSNVIFIFQEPKWLQEFPNGDYKVTTIANFIMGLKSRKIVGNDGLMVGVQDYGRDSITEMNTRRMALSKSAWIITEDTIVSDKYNYSVFKPYKIFTVPTVNNDGNSAPCECKEGDNPKKYFEGYVSEMLGSTEAAADILNSAFVYADEFVKNDADLGCGSLKEYIYDASNLGAVVVKSSIKDLKNTEEGDTTYSDGEETSNQSMYDELSSEQPQSGTDQLTEQIQNIDQNSESPSIDSQSQYISGTRQNYSDMSANEKIDQQIKMFQARCISLNQSVEESRTAVELKHYVDSIDELNTEINKFISLIAGTSPNYINTLNRYAGGLKDMRHRAFSTFINKMADSIV